jgi:hypothetical protein
MFRFHVAFSMRFGSDGFGFLMRSSGLVVRPKELPNMLGNSSTASQCAASDDLQIILAEPDSEPASSVG